ncbi:MAG: DUF1893 domain-containing protein [Oscillospiraceae bacterium]|nr:DUF1893 domain-containing protein [Oscillospiraceae bacterium]
MSDIELAIDMLKRENLSCVILMGDCVYKSQKRGVAPIMELIKNGTQLNGFSVADRVIGKAAALLFVLAGIKEVYSPIMSEPAIEVFRENKIKISFDKSVPYIINRTGDGRCPMEEAVKNTNDPKKAFIAIQNKLNDLTQNN